MNMSGLRIVLEFLLVALIATLIVGAANWYPELPDHVVLHFNASGEPDGWADRSAVLWFLFPAIGVILAVVLRTLGRWMEGSAARSPGSINVPRKELFLLLSEDGRRHALVPTAIYLRWVGVLILALFIYIVEGLAATSIGRVASWSTLPVLGFLVAVLVPLPFMARATRGRIEAAHASEHP